MHISLMTVLVAALTLLPASTALANYGDPEPQISGGTNHTCAMADTGNVYCWGSNAKGQLGTGDTVDRAAPTRVTQVKNVTSISSFAEGTCAVEDVSKVVCWGANELGQLGPTVPNLVKGAYAVSAGQNSVCAMSWDGAKCWGDNSLGQLGVFSSARSALAMGANFGCAANKNNEARCWGANDVGQAAPNKIDNVSDIVAGAAHACAATWQQPMLRCWGAASPDLAYFYDGVGALGSSRGGSCATADPGIPQQPSMPPVRLACWQVGAGAAAGVVSLPLDQVAALSESSSSTNQCAVVRGGAVSCWQEGTSTPTLVPGLDLVKGKHEPFGWIEPKSKLKVNSAGTAWRMRSEATLVPSDFTEVENACRGTATAEIYYLRKARGKKASSANNSPAKVHIGVRTSGKLRRVGSYCRVSFRHTVPLSRFASKRKKLLLGLEFGGNAVMSRYETGYWLGG